MPLTFPLPLPSSSTSITADSLLLRLPACHSPLLARRALSRTMSARGAARSSAVVVPNTADFGRGRQPSELLMLRRREGRRVGIDAVGGRGRDEDSSGSWSDSESASSCRGSGWKSSGFVGSMTCRPLLGVSEMVVWVGAQSGMVYAWAAMLNNGKARPPKKNVKCCL